MKFIIYKDAANEYRWRLQSGNNRIVADSSEGYKRHDKVLKSIARLNYLIISYTTDNDCVIVVDRTRSLTRKIKVPCK
jgi:uncharacterized protein YegP (UPF0339 family)